MKKIRPFLIILLLISIVSFCVQFNTIVSAEELFQEPYVNSEVVVSNPSEEEENQEINSVPQNQQDIENEEEDTEQDYVSSYYYGYNYNANYDYSYNANSRYNNYSQYYSVSSANTSSLYVSTPIAVQEVSSLLPSSSNTPSSEVSSVVSEPASSLSSELTSDNIENIAVFDLLGTGVEISGISNKVVGIIAWCLIVIGVGIVVFVLVRRNPKGRYGKISTGRKRYKRNPYKVKRKRLLSDHYYNYRKYK